MNVSPHFDLREFIPEQIYKTYGDQSIWFVDIRLVEGMEWLRTFFAAPITINNWHVGGTFQYRGFRSPQATVGARLSQHKFGRACDFNVQGMTAPQVFEAIKSDWAVISKHTFFTTIEDVSDTPTWVHLDGRQTRSNELLIVKP